MAETKYKKRDLKEKARIVLEYLTTHNPVEICNKYGIHQNQLYRWRDEFLSPDANLLQAED